MVSEVSHVLSIFKMKDMRYLLECNYIYFWYQKLSMICTLTFVSQGYMKSGTHFIRNLMCPVLFHARSRTCDIYSTVHFHITAIGFISH